MFRSYSFNSILDCYLHQPITEKYLWSRQKKYCKSSDMTFYITIQNIVYKSLESLIRIRQEQSVSICETNEG